MTSRTQPDGGVDAIFKYQIENTNNVLQTPEDVKPFRSSYRKQIGISCLHPRQKLDPQTQQLPKVYGKPMPPSDHYSDYFPRVKFVGVDSIVNEIREQVYASNAQQIIK